MNIIKPARMNPRRPEGVGSPDVQPLKPLARKAHGHSFTIAGHSRTVVMRFAVLGLGVRRVGRSSRSDDPHSDDSEALHGRSAGSRVLPRRQRLIVAGAADSVPACRPRPSARSARRPVARGAPAGLFGRRTAIQAISASPPRSAIDAREAYGYCRWFPVFLAAKG